MPPWVPPPTPLAYTAPRGVFLLVVHQPAPCALQGHTQMSLAPVLALHAQWVPTLLLVLSTVRLVQQAHLPLQLTLHHASSARAVRTATLLPSPLPSVVAMAQPPLATISLLAPPPPLTSPCAQLTATAQEARLLYSSPATLRRHALPLASPPRALATGR